MDIGDAHHPYDRRAAALKGSEEAALREQMDAVLTGFAMIFPGEGWTTGEHPELGDMTDEFADHIVSRVKRLAASLTLAEEAQRETKRAATVAIAMQTMRAASARGFVDPEVMARAWFTSYLEYWKAKGDHPSQVSSWEGLQNELLCIAERVREKFDSQDVSRMDDIDSVAADLLQQGDALAQALDRLSAINTLLRVLWSDSVLPVIRGLHKLGIDILPPGTIVHGVTPSVRPHRPE